MSNRCTIWITAWVACLVACPTSTMAERPIAGTDATVIRQIILRRGADPAAPAQLVQLARTLDPAVAAELFRRVADDYLQIGQFKLAAEVWSYLVDQYPQQELATQGLLDSVRLYASGEIAYRTQQAQPTSVGGDPTSLYALHVAQQASRRRPDWLDLPGLQFQCAVAARRAGRPQTAVGWLTPLKHNPRAGTWHECTRVEDWLAGSREKAPPKPTVTCSRAPGRPHLDGVLDDAVWRATTPLVMPRTPGSGPTEVRLARDEEFFYLALHCGKPPGVAYPADARPRAHDADLAGYDHVRLLLDVDRDYATWFALSIDHRGWTADACWRDGSWNPRWFVAAGANETAWTIEVAVPWAQLCHEPPPRGAAWALAAERRVPDQSAQRWHGVAGAAVGPDNFGLLLFE